MTSEETDELVLRIAVAIAARRDAFKPGEKLAQSYLDDAREAIAVIRDVPQTVPVRGPDCACCEQQPRKDCTVPGCSMKDAKWALPARHTGSLQCLRCGLMVDQEMRR